MRESSAINCKIQRKGSLSVEREGQHIRLTVGTDSAEITLRSAVNLLNCLRYGYDCNIPLIPNRVCLDADGLSVGCSCAVLTTPEIEDLIGLMEKAVA